MKFMQLAVAAALFFLAGFNAAAQQEKPFDMQLHAEEEADRLQKLLDLEDWQVFYVDSTLKHDYPAMIAEYDKLRSSKVSNTATLPSLLMLGKGRGSAVPSPSASTFSSISPSV